MKIKVGINGMGRIGRMVLRSIIETQNKYLKINHINNRSNCEATIKLIKHDSVHGKFNADLKFDKNKLIINKKKLHFLKRLGLKMLIGRNITLTMCLNVLVNLILKKNC